MPAISEFGNVYQKIRQQTILRVLAESGGTMSEKEIFDTVEMRMLMMMPKLDELQRVFLNQIILENVNKPKIEIGTVEKK